MRRWLAIFLMIIVPLQFSYAAASAYCQHESGQQAKHFGHHTHVHHDEAGHESDQGVSMGKVDHDCGSCHMGALQLLPQHFDTAVLKLTSPHGLPATGSYSSVDRHRIERPNWTVSL